MLMTVKEAAALLKVPAQRIYELARENMIPVVRVGRQVRVDGERLRAWIRGGGAASAIIRRHRRAQ